MVRVRFSTMGDGTVGGLSSLEPSLRNWVSGPDPTQPQSFWPPAKGLGRWRGEERGAVLNRTDARATEAQTWLWTEPDRRARPKPSAGPRGLWPTIRTTETTVEAAVARLLDLMEAKDLIPRPDPFGPFDPLAPN